MKALEILKDSRFGKLVIVEESASIKKTRHFKCKCDCGNECTKSIKALTKAGISSCGCFQKEFNTSPRINQRSENHLYLKTRLYTIWVDMKRRCFSKNTRAYKWYGLKGIIVCDEWKNRFLNFQKWALENGYDDNMTIDRIDSDKNYEPTNCRWVPFEFQNRNKKNNRKVIFNGIEMCVSEAAKLTGKPYTTLISKLNKGLNIKEAVL